MKKDLQNGRSMIEMLGVLSIIGILTVGGFNLVSKTVSENRVNKVIDEVGDLARRTRVVFREFIYDCKDKNSGTCSNGSDMSEYIHDAKSYPTALEWVDSSNECNKCFLDDEDVQMTVSYKQESDVEYYVLKIAAMSEEICMAIANGQWGTMAANGFSGISFEASSVIKGSVDLTAATTSCTDNSTIFLAFR